MKKTTFELELQNAKPMETHQTETGKQLVLDTFDSNDTRYWALKAGDILRRNYKGYGWIIRGIGNHRDKIDRRGIGITVQDIAVQFGSNICEYLNPTDWATEHEFEQKVKEAGGRLLERARLCRSQKVGDNLLDKTPDGFEEFLPKVRYRVAETKEEAIAAITKHVQNSEQEEAIAKDMAGADSRDLPKVD